jgi:hypothetical protein
MTDLVREKQAERLTAKTKELRAEKFKNNQPFLILSNKLPTGQSYLEYPNGKIKIQHIGIQDNQYVPSIVRELTEVEAYRVRSENGLL